VSKPSSLLKKSGPSQPLLKAEHTVSFLSKFENPTAIFRARNRSNGIKPALKESDYA